jgi:TIR domain-containing protein
MSSLADFPELVGFFSYSREDDEDSNGALSALRDRIQRELRGQLGRSFKSFRLWQDKEAIAPGKLWESEIRTAVEHSAFFIPIITPTVVKSPFCKFELDSFLARERALGRSDLVFPILYIRVPSLEDGGQQDDPVLSIIASRQYVDWREFRQLDVNSTEVKQKVESFCEHVVEALHEPWSPPEQPQNREAEQTPERHERAQLAQETVSRFDSGTDKRPKRDRTDDVQTASILGTMTNHDPARPPQSPINPLPTPVRMFRTLGWLLVGLLYAATVVFLGIGIIGFSQSAKSATDFWMIPLFASLGGLPFLIAQWARKRLKRPL